MTPGVKANGVERGAFAFLRIADLNAYGHPSLHFMETTTKWGQLQSTHLPAGPGLACARVAESRYALPQRQATSPGNDQPPVWRRPCVRRRLARPVGVRVSATEAADRGRRRVGLDHDGIGKPGIFVVAREFLAHGADGTLGSPQ